MTHTLRFMPTSRFVHGVRLAGVILLAIYLGAAAALVLTRNGWSVNRLNVFIWIHTVGDAGLQLPISPEQFAAIANVLLFVPLFFAAALVRRSWWWVIVGSGLSSLIELTQLIRGGRDASIGDVLANTLGATIGLALGVVVHRGVRSLNDHRLKNRTSEEDVVSDDDRSEERDRLCGN